MLNWLTRYASVANELGFDHEGQLQESVLDVGCGSHGLAAACSGVRFVGIDVTFPGPVAAGMVAIRNDPGPLPFDTAAFETVICLDVLEHVPAADRGGLIRELCRVASRRVIVACPTRESESVQALLKLEYGARALPTPPWLNEHDEHGLPSVSDVQAICSTVPGFQARELQLTNGLLATLLVMADMLPEIAPEATREFAENREQWLTVLSNARFGHSRRRGYVIERVESLPPLVSPADIEHTVWRAVRCPQCGGMGLLERPGGAVCSACAAPFGRDRAGALNLTHRPLEDTPPKTDMPTRPQHVPDRRPADGTPMVSVLVPAFRPDFLDACISSALAQTFTDFELLVGDDCPGDEVLAVLRKWQDPRIRYARNPARGQPGSNRDMLIHTARGRYIKFLFDDDVLLPTSVETLMRLAQASDAKMAFHANYSMDRLGRTSAGPVVIPDGKAAVLAREQLFDTLIARGVNFIGGPVNILVERAAINAIRSPFGLEPHRMRFLTDVALYANLVDRGHTIIGTGARLSGFRIHGQQSSSPDSPIHMAGVFEWELVVRWSADRWGIERTRASQAIARVHNTYVPESSRHPELSHFVSLGVEPDASGHFMTQAFRDLLEEHWARIDQAGSIVPSEANAPRETA